MDQGERLKNFSLRLWNREALCHPRKRVSSTTTKPIKVKQTTVLPTTAPALSTSVDSVSSTENKDEPSSSPDVASSIPIPTNTSNHTQLKDRHITPADLCNLVASIKQPREFPRPTPKPMQPQAHPATPANSLAELPAASQSDSRHPATESSTSTVATTTDSLASTGGKTDTSVSSNGSSHSIVRGFTPGRAGIASYRSASALTAQKPQPILKKSPPAMATVSNKKCAGIFMLGAASCSGDEASLQSPESSTPADQSSAQPTGKKQTSFKEEVAVMKPAIPSQDEAVFESDDETSEDESPGESAIEDDDDEEAWEDDGSDAEPQDERKDEPKEMTFGRVDSKAHLPSRRSLLTLNIEGQRNGQKGFVSAPAFRRSRTATPNGPSMPASPEEESKLEEQFAKLQTSHPFTATNNQRVPQPNPCTSPKTTRRNMMAGELSESLRRNMLHERQQKNQVKLDAANNQMRRAHTASDVSQLPKVDTVTKSTGWMKTGTAPHFNFDNSLGDFNHAGW